MQGEHAEAAPTEFAACPPRERATAIIALIVAFILALAVVLTAIFAQQISGLGGQGGISTANGSTAGVGGGRGTGHGTGTGSGSAAAGAGTGAGAMDADHARTGMPLDALAQGSPLAQSQASAEAMPTGAAPEGGAASATPPPAWGFSRPEDPVIPVAPPSVAPPAGIADGTAGEGAAGAGGSEFMGIQSKARVVVYVIDCSGSMEGLRLAHTKLELVRSIESLPDEGRFSVIFFSDSFMTMPPQKLVDASKQAKQHAIAWLRMQPALGGTDPSDALRTALEMRPDAIFLMTDGVFADVPRVFATIQAFNGDGHTSINTIAFHERVAEQILQQIANENHGDYRYVPPPSQVVP